MAYHKQMYGAAYQTRLGILPTTTTRHRSNASGRHDVIACRARSTPHGGAHGMTRIMATRHGGAAGTCEGGASLRIATARNDENRAASARNNQSCISHARITLTSCAAPRVVYVTAPHALPHQSDSLASLSHCARRRRRRTALTTVHQCCASAPLPHHCTPRLCLSPRASRQATSVTCGGWRAVIKWPATHGTSRSFRTSRGPHNTPADGGGGA